MSGEATWRQDANQFLLSCGALRGTLEPGRPESGLTAVQFGESPLAGTLLGVTTPGGPLDDCDEAYARGADCVGTYSGSDAFPFRTQLAWSARPLDRAPGVALTLTASLQTDLLDTRPEFEVGATLTADDPSEVLDEGVFVFEPNADATLVVTPHPSDADETRSSVAAGQHRLVIAPPFLEKGVIRRCRVAALVLDGRPSTDSIREAIGEFVNEPLPLTA